MKKTEKERIEKYLMSIDLYSELQKTILEMDIRDAFPRIEVPNHGSSMQVRDSSRPVPDNNEI